MTRSFALVVLLDSYDNPREVAKEVVSNLEFDNRSSVRCVIVLDDNGKKVAVYDRKEMNQ